MEWRKSRPLRPISRPGPPTTTTHTRTALASRGRKNALGDWEKNAKNAKKRNAPQELSIQAWLIYRIRFVRDGESFGAFAEFGGLASQLNLVAVVLNLEVWVFSSLAHP